MEAGADGVSDFARMGNWGANPQNLFRAMRNALGNPAGAPEMAWYEIPTKAGPRTPHPFLLPHEFLSSFYNARSKDDFRKHIAGPVGACRQFWESMRDTAFVREHPNLAEHTFPYTIPIGMHADAGAFSKQDSIYVFNWNSLVGRGTTHQKRFIFTVMRKGSMSVESLDAILNIFSWSMNVLLEGKTPERSPFDRPLLGGGVPLAGSWRAALCQARGDWAFYKECFHFPQWNAAERMCFVCRASSTIRRLSWTNFNDDAPWRGAYWTHQTYLDFLRGDGSPIPVLLLHVIGFRLECIMIDVLHTVDLGVTAHIVGNIFFIYAVSRAVYGGATYKERVERLAQKLKQWYNTNRVTSRLQGALTLERLRDASRYPKLKGKAAALRHLARFALTIVIEHHNGTPHDNLVQGVIQLLIEFYNIIESSSQFLSEKAKENLPRIGMKLAQLYGELAQLAYSDEERLWKLSPKLHLLEHLLEVQAILYGNPRWYWTYADEDLVGLMIDIAEGCHPLTMPVSVLFKWLHTSFPED
jgi:hypothetical protein